MPEITANLPAVKAPTEALRINEAQSPMRWSSRIQKPAGMQGHCLSRPDTQAIEGFSRAEKGKGVDAVERGE